MYQKFENYLRTVLETPKKKKQILWGTLAAFMIAVLFECSSASIERRRTR